ncbi:hypothetical protein COL922a_014238, partial [Colletotrichum nupharicola]
MIPTNTRQRLRSRPRLSSVLCGVPPLCSSPSKCMSDSATNGQVRFLPSLLSPAVRSPTSSTSRVPRSAASPGLHLPTTRSKLTRRP